MSVNTNQLSVAEIVKIIRDIDQNYEHADISLAMILQEEISEDSKYLTDDAKKYFNELRKKLGCSIKLLESFRDQGGGDYDGYTWRLELNGRYFEVYGNYSSWEGYDCDDWCDLHEVKKVSKTVEVFEPI